MAILEETCVSPSRFGFTAVVVRLLDCINKLREEVVFVFDGSSQLFKDLKCEPT